MRFDRCFELSQAQDAGIRRKDDVKSRSWFVVCQLASKEEKNFKFTVVRLTEASSGTMVFDNGDIVPAVAERALPVVSGCIAFGSTLAMSTLLQKLVGISTGTRTIPSVLGFFSVCSASVASQHAAIASYSWLDSQRHGSSRQSRQKANNRPTILASSSFARTEHVNIAGICVPMHDLRVAAIGVVSFKLLGGRFWAISPSSYTHIGSFARWSIPCGEEYATKAQRTAVERMGRRWGCHTCGSKMILHRGRFSFVGDHMPPKSVAEQMNRTWWRKFIVGKVKYRFYPQCANCSNVQGTILAKAQRSTGLYLPAFRRASALQHAGGGSNSYFHGLTPRLNHLTGGVLAGITTIEAGPADVLRGNQRRFRSLQQSSEKWLRFLYE